MYSEAAPRCPAPPGIPAGALMVCHSSPADWISLHLSSRIQASASMDNTFILVQLIEVGVSCYSINIMS